MLGDEPAAGALEVAFDGVTVTHVPQGTAPATLDQYASAISDELDRMALRVGALLAAAKAEHPASWAAWVEEALPFGLDTARRLVAIHEAFSTRPPELIAQLPRPWQALYAIRRLSDADLQSAVASGELSPSTTVKATVATARRWLTGNAAPRSGPLRTVRADLAAGALMEFTPADLDPAVRRALTSWLRDT